MSSVVAAHASCGASRSVITPGIGGLAPSVLDCGNILNVLRLGFCPILGKGCGISCPTIYRAGSVGLNRGGNICFCGLNVSFIVTAHAGCGARLTVSCEIICYRPSMLKSINYFRIRMVAANFTSISSDTCFRTCRCSGDFRNVILVITLNYCVSAISRNSDILICKIITYVCREITAGNYRNTLFLSKYNAGRPLGGGISYGKFTAADINSAIKGINVTINRSKFTAVYNSLAPVTNQIIICRCCKLSAFDRKLAVDSNAKSIFELEASAAYLKATVYDKRVSYGVDVLNVEGLAIKIPFNIAVNNDLLENYDGISLFCSRDRVFKSNVVFVTDACKSGIVTVITFRSALNKVVTGSGSRLSSVYVTASAGVSGISVFKTGGRSCLGGVTMLSVYIYSISIGSCMVSILTIFGHILGEFSALYYQTFICQKIAGFVITGAVGCRGGKFTAVDGSSSGEIVDTAILSIEGTAVDNGFTAVGGDQIIVVSRVGELAAVYGEFAGNTDAVITVRDNLTALNSKVALDYEAVIFITVCKSYGIFTKTPLLRSFNSELFGKNNVLEELNGLAVLCIRDCFN